MSLWNLSNVLRFLPTFQQRSELSINSGNCDSTYAKSALKSNW